MLVAQIRGTRGPDRRNFGRLGAFRADRSFGFGTCDGRLLMFGVSCAQVDARAFIDGPRAPLNAARICALDRKGIVVSY